MNNQTEEYKVGIYPNIPEAEYFGWDLPNYSTLALFRNEDMCELEIRYALDHPREQTDEMSLGKLVEQAVDDPDSVGSGVEKLPPEIKVRRGVAWQEFEKEHPGIIFLPPSEYAKHESVIKTAKDMAASVHSHELAEKLIIGSEKQVSFICDLTFVGQDGRETTHRVKGRVDYLNREEGIISDLKTMAFGNPRRVGSRMWEYAYDVQSALYTDSISKLLDKEMRFYFIVCRSAPPYVVTIYNGHNSTEMAGHYLNIGRNAYQCYMDQLAECRKTGIWRGYFTPDAPESRVLDIYLPAWAV